MAAVRMKNDYAYAYTGKFYGLFRYFTGFFGVQSIIIPTGVHQ